jgi:YEATS family
MLALMSASHGRQYELANVSTYIGNDLWRWTVFLRAPANLLSSVSYVEYTLHPTFIDRVQRVRSTGDPKYPFGLTRTGWGIFEIRARVVLKTGEAKSLRHMLVFEPGAVPPCEQPFEMEERHYCRIPGQAFGGRLYAYVGEIHKGFKRQSFRITVFISDLASWSNSGRVSEGDFRARIRGVPKDQRWSSELANPQDSVVFRFAGVLYKAEVGTTKSSASGHENVSVQVCEK